ncbi:MAG TPA: response regulator [Thermoanaerobaculaceae bacterium]|nr:response regulator [Thermoanaerobaculaceae bacterium]HRS14752.1 response regulator [Thermoanaerobaculaceae bacterium]
MTTAGSLPSGGTVLAVDDQPENLALVEEVLSDEGFRVRLAADGEEALAVVAADLPDCIVLDVMMPRLDGFEVCRRLKSSRDTHFVPVVMLTALSGVDDKVRAYELGADDFLNKPVEINELSARVRSLVRIKRLRDELDTSESIVISMVQALESKDPRTAGHSQRVAVLAGGLAQHLRLPAEQVELVTRGALLHDIGKIGLPDRLLGPEHTLAGRGGDEYRHHAILGERILIPFSSFAGARAIVRGHHERLDGSGYPDGLCGAAFTLPIEVVALANQYDAIASSEGPEAAAETLRLAAARGEYHPEVVEALVANVAPHADLAAHWSDLLPLPSGGRRGRILLGDDLPSSREFLRTVLEGEGHEVVCVETAEAVLEAVEHARPDLVMVDLHGQSHNGFELTRVLKSHPGTEFLPVILVAAQRELSDHSGDPRVWADDFLVLPVNRLELVARVNSLLRIRQYFRGLEEHHSVILSLASALEAKDPYTRGHSERVGVLAASLGRELGLPASECRLLHMAGQLHDIGKIGIPEAVLNKEGRLDPSELEKVRQHPDLGELICRPLKTLRRLLELIRHHHERYDGSGYPDGLAGEEISLGARILGLVDAYDALTSARSYRRSFTQEQALELLGEEAAAGRWDPEVFATLVQMVRRPSPPI